ncbi:MAG: FAD-dependent oxidoreductase, partial [Clostridia bacterium]|nr:FAD-dependent oxidoreductase [Clostridia bacterium]
MDSYRYDVVVAGGGPAGIAAAIVSARAGRKTAIIERYGCVGGGITSSYVRPFLGSVQNENVGNEIEKRIHEAESFCSPVEAAKIVLAEMIREAGIDLFLQSQVVSSDAVSDESGIKTVKSITAVSHGKEYTFFADAFIDATGDGDLSVISGAEYEIGREADGLV